MMRGLTRDARRQSAGSSENNHPSREIQQRSFAPLSSGKSQHLQGAFAFPLRPGAQGRFELLEPGQALKQQLQLLLSTARGERMMRPDYGCRVHDLLFSPNNPSTRGRLLHAVEEAIEGWEDRVRELELRVLEGGEGSEKVELEIRYSESFGQERESLRYVASLGDSED